MCPADECDDASASLGLCPVDAPPVENLFHWREGFADPIVDRYLEFCRYWGIGIAGFEFIETGDGRLVTYDINTNTNYNRTAEERAKVSAPRQLAIFLGSLLEDNVEHLKSAVI